MSRLWASFVAVMVLSFLVLGWIGTRIYQEMPPIPEKVVTTDGQTLIRGGEISAGQNVWQSLGGMEVGSIWGHGSYVAPDWTADWLHRESLFILDRWAETEHGQKFAGLDNEQQAQLVARLTSLMHTNTFDSNTQTLTIDPIRVAAFESNLAHYTEVFSEGNADYAIPAGAVSDPDRLRKLSSFFFWTAWAASTDRLDGTSSYTNNWPHEPLIGNRPTGDNIVWTGVSIIVLLAGISAMAWWYASKRGEEEEPTPPASDPLALWEATPSQRATIKYFWVVSALILVQMLLGVVTAHYGVEGRRVLWISTFRLAAVQRNSHMACPDRPVLDRHGMVGSRSVHRPARKRPRTQGAKTRRKCLIRCIAGCGYWIAHGRVVEHPQ